MHDAEPAEEYDPAGHCAQSDSPGDAEYNPAGHSSQEPVDQYCPAGQIILDNATLSPSLLKSSRDEAIFDEIFGCAEEFRVTSEYGPFQSI
jgi:hypothetical protein